MQNPDNQSLLRHLRRAGELERRFIANNRLKIALKDIHDGSCLDRRIGELSGRAVLIATKEQLATALALIELDGIVRRLVIAPADLTARQVNSVIRDAELDTLVTDDAAFEATGSIDRVRCAPNPAAKSPESMPVFETEWILLTSGTTGDPKMVVHSLGGLTGAIKTAAKLESPTVVWATFYDIRRYGGLQIFLRAVVAGGSLVLSSPEEGIADHLVRLTREGVTHMSGTPSHWRRALMTPAASSFSPRYVRLSGEIADQAVLDNLGKAFPAAAIGHAFASTEAGVAFDVNDGLAGFPASFVERDDSEVQLKVANGSLMIRSDRTARFYVGPAAAALRDADGFVDTGDMVELCGARYVFTGRRSGIVNVGGLKVHPEEVEAVINLHSEVSMTLVKGRRNPITGSLVIAEIVLKDRRGPARSPDDVARIRREIIELCREKLAPHKVPVTVTVTQSIEVMPTGKVARANA